MIPGNDELYACPNCRKCCRKQTLMSGNSFGGTYYSDARVSYPFLPKFPKKTRCSACNEIFELNQTNLNTIESSECSEYADFLDIDGYKELLLIGNYTDTDDELDDRFELLWTWHERIENNSLLPDEVFSDFYYVKNIDEIIATMEPDVLGRILLIAELHRYAGRFETAVSMFEPHLEEQEFGIAKASYQRCLNEDRSVYIVKKSS